jgi:hypothetical protein
MDSRKKPARKIFVLLGAVLIIQCCCCIIPYSWNARMDTSTFAAPIEVDEEFRLPPRESLKADSQIEGVPSGKQSWIETHTEAVSGNRQTTAQEYLLAGWVLD